MSYHLFVCSRFFAIHVEKVFCTRVNLQPAAVERARTISVFMFAKRFEQNRTNRFRLRSVVWINSRVICVCMYACAMLRME